MGPNSENAFPEDTFWPNSIHIKTFLKLYNQQKKRKKIMFGSENTGKTLFFMSLHFDQTMTILISHFLRFGALRKFIDDCFVIRINKIIYSKQDMGCFINFSIYTTLFLRFGALKNFTGDCFVIWINNITHSNKTWNVLLISVFLQHFSHSMFFPFICTGWHTNGVWMK